MSNRRFCGFIETAVYREVVQCSGIVEICDAVCEPGGCWFVYDGARAHQAQARMGALSRIGLLSAGMASESQRPQPDRDDLVGDGWAVGGLAWTSTADVFQRLRAIWDALDMEVGNRLVWPLRVAWSCSTR